MIEINKFDLIIIQMKNILYYYNVGDFSFYVKRDGKMRKVIWYNEKEKCYKGIKEGKIIKIPSLSIEDILKVFCEV